LNDALAEGRVDAALALITPAELYSLSRQWVGGESKAGVRLDEAGKEPATDSPAYEELTRVAAAAPQDCSDAAISRMFGVPRPKLSRSWRPELLGLAPLPALQGYSSRLLAESWESNNLYWARLADELNLPPASLDWLAPQLTQRLIEQIFANHHEDWPALLRALRETTEEYRRSATHSGTSATEE